MKTDVENHSPATIWEQYEEEGWLPRHSSQLYKLFDINDLIIWQRIDYDRVSSLSFSGGKVENVKFR